MYMPEMTWKEIEEVLPKVKTAIIPSGSTEQHGPHLPLQTDTALCLHICRKTAQMLSPTVLVTPPVSVGVSRHHMKFPGSLTLRPETFINVISELAWSLKQHGISKIVIINGHGGNQAAVKLAARKIHDELGLIAASMSYWEILSDEKARNILETYPSRRFPGHACEFETSISYVVQPELVRKERIGKSDEVLLSVYEDFLAKIEDEYATSGVCRGDPRTATREKGERLVEAITKELSIFVRRFSEHGYEI